MSYLDKAKRAISQKLTDPEPLPATKETNYTKKGSETAQTLPNELRNNPPDAVPGLPWQLERLIRAASLDDPLRVDVRGVLDPNRYVMAWGCAYLTGDRDEAVRRLWLAYRAWQVAN